MAIDLEEIKAHWEFLLTNWTGPCFPFETRDGVWVVHFANGTMGYFNEGEATITAKVAHDLPLLIDEIKRLRAEATTTRMVCEQCGRGVPPRYAVAGMCAECAQVELAELRQALKGV